MPTDAIRPPPYTEPSIVPPSMLRIVLPPTEPAVIAVGEPCPAPKTLPS